MRNIKYPIIYHPTYDIPLPENHRFPGTKYSALIKELETTGIIENYLKYVPKPATAKYLSIAHDPFYIQAIETGNLSKQEQTKLYKTVKTTKGSYTKKKLLRHYHISNSCLDASRWVRFPHG